MTTPEEWEKYKKEQKDKNSVLMEDIENLELRDKIGELPKIKQLLSDEYKKLRAKFYDGLELDIIQYMVENNKNIIVLDDNSELKLTKDNRSENGYFIRWNRNNKDLL